MIFLVFLNLFHNSEISPQSVLHKKLVLIKLVNYL